MSINTLIPLLHNKNFMILVNLLNTQSSVSLNISNANVKIDEGCLFIENMDRSNIFVDLGAIQSIGENNEGYIIKTDEMEININR